MAKVYTVQRPYLLTFRATGSTYTITSREAQRLLDEYPVVSATAQRVVLGGHNTGDPKQRAVLRPATLGGGPAFTVARTVGEELALRRCPVCKRGRATAQDAQRAGGAWTAACAWHVGNETVLCRKGVR